RARDDGDVAAGRERNDDAHGPRRIGLRVRRLGACARQSKQRDAPDRRQPPFTGAPPDPDPASLFRKAGPAPHALALAFSASARMPDKVARGVIASGSILTSMTAGLPDARVRSSAGSNSAVAVTHSPCAPYARASAAKSGLRSIVPET